MKFRPAPVLLVLALTAAAGTACSTKPPPPVAVMPDEHTTLFGSTVWQAPGEVLGDAVARVDASYGPIRIVRLFSSWLPPSWDGLRRDLGRRPVVVSFRPSPRRILTGELDDQLRAWFAQAPRDRDTWWSYQHEPEDEIERGVFTAEEFRAAWSHVAQLADQADNPRLHATMTLMCWTAAKRSGRDWRDYVPTGAAVQVLAWDCYAKGGDAETYADPAELLDPARQVAGEAGADWAVAELGAQIGPGGNDSDRAAWLDEVGAYARRNDAVFVTYFDAPIGGEFRLLDEASSHAWAAQVASTPRHSRRRAQASP